jgi:hypothetical protein
MQPHYQTRMEAPFQGATPREEPRRPTFPQHSQARQVNQRPGGSNSGVGRHEWEDTETWQPEIAVHHSAAGTSQPMAQEWGHRPNGLPQLGPRHSDAGGSWEGEQPWDQPQGVDGMGGGPGWGSENNAQGGWNLRGGGGAVPAQRGPWQGQANPSHDLQQGGGYPHQQSSGYGHTDNTQVWR